MLTHVLIEPQVDKVQLTTLLSFLDFSEQELKLINFQMSVSLGSRFLGQERQVFSRIVAKIQRVMPRRGDTYLPLRYSSPNSIYTVMLSDAVDAQHAQI